MNAYLPTFDPLLVWGLFKRGLGLVFLISFTSLSLQIVNGAGKNGAISMTRRLAKFKEDFPTWRRFYYFPTLLWLNSSDAMLRGITLVGIAAAALLIYGGPAAVFALPVCYICYLSIDLTMAIIFPWDCLLFEATVLGLFLPATRALPDLHAVAAPAAALTWAYRFLLFRVMFGFGKQKFLGSRSKDLAYLKGFLVNQPLPSKVAWYAQKAPVFFLKGAVLFMFITEIPVPFFAFVPGPLSLVCFACTVFLMIGIQLMGSFGYFSLATIVMSIPLLDNTTPLTLHVTELFSAGQPVLANAYVLLHSTCACAALIFNSWLGQSWLLWAFWFQLPRWVQPVFGFLRIMHPFRWLHPFGVFPPNNTPAVKITLLLEVSWDRENWHELEFRYSPCNPRSEPRFVAPHHPRGDQAVIYDTFGLNPTSLVSSVLGAWDPYPFGSKAPAVSFCQSILRGRGFDFIKEDKLYKERGLPALARITTVMLEPVSIAEHRKTGNWWKRTYIGPHAAPEELDPEFWDDAVAEPELWHFDAIFWRRRSKLGKVMQRALAGTEDPMQLAVAESNGALTSEHVARFWSEFVPLIGDPGRRDFDTLPELVARVRKDFDRKTRRAFYRLLNRFAMLVVAKLEPMYLHRGLKPLIPVKTYFHLWMLSHHIIGCGKDAYLKALADPASVTAYIPELTTQTGLYALSIFRFEEMIFEAQKLRLIESYIFPHDPAIKKANALKVKSADYAALKPAERLVLRVGTTVSGFFNVIPDIRDSFKGPRFDRGYPELYPIFEELDSGAVVVREYTRPPPGESPPMQASSQPAE